MRLKFIILLSLVVTSGAFAQTCNTGPCTGACVFPVTVEKGCNCFDGKDNDGNGLIDSADPICASYYGLTFVGQGSNCSITPPGNNSGFASIAPPQTSSQNTADTPSKISVGDMNGDGVPDAVVTSKWNSTIQVVATATASGFSPGNIMADFTTPGSKIFPKAGSNYVFEHETAIADINKDGIGEMYAIASYRGGSPNNPPTKYFLTGFQYATGKGKLIPLFKAVDLGSVRPGSIGIADFDGDGKAEVYLRNQIYAAESGVKLADGGGNWLTQISSGPVAVNMLGDNKLELVCGNFIYSVPSLSSRSLQTITVAKDLNALGLGPHYYPKGYNDVNQYGLDQVSTTSTADIDADGFMDVVITGSINCSGNEAIPCANNITTIFYWNVQKGTLSTFSPPDPVYPANGWIWGTGRVNLDDATGDGKMDLIFVAGAQIFCLGLNAAGKLTQQWVRAINDNPGVLSLTVYDFNNDGNPEVVYRDAQQLAVADGKTGQTTIWSSTCQAYTFTEGPIVADVNGDGSTDIRITCYTSNAFNLAHDTPQQESLGQTRLYFSSTNSWLPTRKIWNQHPYYVTNITDKLTLPFPQLNPSLIFGNAPCPNGIPGPNRPFNVFMDQVPTLSANGCPIFPAPNLTFFGDTPNPACLVSPLPTGCDTNGDGVYQPTVVITPPICGNLNIQAQFNLTNNGNLNITDNVPVSFFNGDPTTNPTRAVRLFNTTIAITNLAVGATFTSPTFTFNGPGTAFTLYIAIYNDGSVLPLNFSTLSNKDCNITDKVYSVPITPTPFTVTVEKVSDNNNCPPYNPPNTGQLKAHIFVGATEVVDLSPYSFQWYNGTTTASPIAGANLYNLSGLVAGTYSVVVTNTQKGCSSGVVSGTIANVNGGFPSFTINKISDQTLCSPPNGELMVVPSDGSTGYTYTWLDTNLNPIGVTGPDAKNLVAGNYVLNITRGTCSYPGSRPQQFVNGPVVPNAQAQTLQNVIDCSNPNSGSIKADALDGLGNIQNPANYTFNWYFYNNATGIVGSILPGTYGTGQTRTGLPVGYYQAVIIDKTTLCTAAQSPITQVVSQTVIPDPPIITQLAPQTSCDPSQPNGSMIANVTIGGVPASAAGFTFQWFKGQNTLPANLVSTVSGVNGQQVNNVSGGGIPYTVKVTTANNCSSTANAPVVEVLNIPVISPTSTPNSVCNSALSTNPYNGSVTAAVSFAGSNVIPPSNGNYHFTWYNGPTTASPVIAVADDTSPVLPNLKDGNYTVVVNRSDLHCTSNASTITVAKSVVIPLLVATSTGSNNCNAALTPDGTASVSVNNSVPGDVFTYQWYAGNTVGVGPLGAANTGTTSTATKIGGPVGAPNTYTVLVTNTTTGCQNNTSQLVADNSVIPVLSFLSIVPNSICSPSTNFNGSLTATVNNFPVGYTISDYAFTWYDGNSNASPVDPTSTTSVLNKLDAGFYTVEAKNTKTGCPSAPITSQVPNAKILPALSPSFTGSHNCQNSVTPDGSASVSVSNSLAGETFAYQWYSGNVVGVSPLGLANHGTSATATNIGGPTGAPNPYTALVTNNSTGCFNSITTAVPDLSAAPILSLTVTDNSICSAGIGFNGSIASSFTDTNGPAGPHTYLWSQGSDMSSPIVLPPSTSSLTGQKGGQFFTATITNTALACTSSPITVEIKDNHVLPSIAATPTPSTNCPGGVNNGTIAVNVTNAGANTFSFVWSPGNVISGTTIASTDGAATSTISNQKGGQNYTVQATNNQTGCFNAFTQILADNSSKPTFALVPVPNTNCVAPKNGSISVTGLTDANAIGGDTYTNVFYGGNSTAAGVVQTGTALALGSQAPGFVTVTVTNDRLNCTSNAVTAEILETLTYPTISTSVFNSTNCAGGTANGTATVTSVVEPGPYEYRWYSGTIAGVPNAFINTSLATPGIAGIQGSSSANYTVQVTLTTSGCAGTKTITVQDGSQLPLITPLNSADNTNCVLPKNGTAFVNAVTPFTYQGVTVTNPYNGFSLSWSTGATNVDNISSLAAGTYTLQVTANNNPITNNDDHCISNLATVTINDNLVYPVISIAVTDQTSCGSPNGKLAAIGDGVADATHTFAWFDGNGTATPHGAAQISTGVINQLASSDYTVQVTTNSTGCVATQTAFVPNNIVTPSLSFTNVNPVTSCISPNGSATASLTGLSAPTKYDLFYVFTISSSGNPYPTDPVVIKASLNPNNITNGNSIPSPAAYGGAEPGYITALLVDKNTSCESVPVTQQIIDNTSLNKISISGITAAGFCGGIGGGVTTLITGGVGAHTFSWYNATPTNTNISFFNNSNPPNFGAAPVVATTQNLGLPSTPPGVGAGTYTLVVTDAVGCGAYLVQSVPFINSPTITITPTPVTNCVTPDGAIKVDVVGLSASGYAIQIFTGNSPVIASQINSSGPPTITLTSSALAKGDYYVQVTDQANVACPQGSQVTLPQNALPPIITTSVINPNTSCIPNSAGDGSIKLMVTKDASDTTTPNYDITAIDNPTHPAYVFPVNIGASGNSKTLTGFEPLTYTITVTDNVSQCQANTVIAIPNKEDTPNLLSLALAPETDCAPFSNGSALISIQGGEPTTEFDFTWAQNADLSSVVYAATGNGTNAGELLNKSNATLGSPGNFWPLGATGLGSGDRTVYVQGTKNATAATGVGCKTSIEKVIIQDQHVVPDMTLTSLPNTSCDPLVGEGSISITMVTNSPNGAISGANYNYLLDPLGAALPVNNTPGATSTPYTALLNNTYTIRATNIVSGCKVEGTNTVASTKYSMAITQFLSQDKLMCNPDGSIKVTEIQIATSSPLVYSSAVVPTLSNNFDFRWFRNSSGTFSSPSALVDGSSTVIGIESLTAGGGAGQYPSMGAGTFYVVAKRKSGAGDLPLVGQGCETPPFQINIADKHVNPAVVLKPLSDTSCGGTFEGEIDVTVSDASVTVPPSTPYSFNYAWTTTSTTTPGVVNPYAVGATAFTALENGDYTLTVGNNQTGCTVSASTTIIKNRTPIFITATSVIPKFYCKPSGNITVNQVQFIDRNNATQTPALTDFIFTWTQPNGSAVPGAVTASRIDSLNFGGIVPGLYQVFATRTSGTPGAGCVSAPVSVEIKDKSVNPSVVLTPASNTSCSASFEGSIQLLVTDSSVPTSPPVAFNYDYTWSDPNASGITLPPNQSAQSGGSSSYVNLQEGTYKVSVINNISGCTASQSTVIVKNATPVFTQSVTPTDQVLCIADGKLVVNEVRLIDRTGNVQSNVTGDFPLSDFVFTYDRTTIGNTVLGGSASTQLTAGNYGTIGADTYFVTAKRTSGVPGNGCSSAPYRVAILNKQVYPVVSLTPQANTSCDPAFFEGGVQVNVVDNSVNLPLPLTGAPFLFKYTWTASATPAFLGTITNNNNGDGSAADADGDYPQGLKEGVYTVVVENYQTQCSAQGTTTIFKNSTPVFTQSVLATDQVLCKPDGKLLVKEVKVIDRNGNVESNLNGDFPLSDFVFSYDRSVIGNTVLGNSAATQLDNVNYPTIGFDSYYVVATRKTGGPGQGCSSAPYLVAIQDKRLFPKGAFTSTDNSSCNTAKPNGSVTVDASEQNGTNSDPYTFAWTLNAGALSPVSTQSNTSNSSIINNALDGTYVATITNTNTGCPIDETFLLQLDQTRSTPNIIDISTIDAIDCNPSASAAVTKITIGSTFNSITQPPNIAPNNAITGPALASFIYQWSSGTPTNVIAGQTGPNIVGLVSGTYFVTVTDPSTDCQSGPKEADILSNKIIYPVVSIAQTAKQISCLVSSGTAALSASAQEQDGTTGNYTFVWYPSTDLTGTSIAGPSGANPNPISNLFVGNYSVKVQNAVTSCVASALFVVPDDSPEFSPIISATSSPLTYCVGKDGDAQVRILVNPSYPLQPYSYTTDLYFASKPNLASPPDVANISAAPGTFTYDSPGLANGYYTFKVTDNKTGCVDTAGVRVQDKRIKPVIAIVQDNPLTHCDPSIANGQLAATADNGKIQGYTFDWYAGAMVTNPGSPLQVDNKLIGEGTGQYVVRVTNNTTGCFDDKSGNITDGTVKPPSPDAVVIANRTSCITPNGEVAASVGGNVIDYSFNWFIGSLVKPAADYQSPDYPGRDVGPYTVTAKSDSTGCESLPVTVTVLDNRVTPVFELSSTPSYCSDTGKPKGNGSLTLTLDVTGMVLSSIQWTDESNTPVGLGPQIFDLFPGVYKVHAVSTEGCAADGTVAIATEIFPYNGISSNGDGKNDNFIIDCITNYPDNNVKIFNRAGIMVYEANGYNNGTVSFNGLGEKGIYIGSNALPVGTYFYIIDKRDGTKPKTGYLELTH